MVTRALAVLTGLSPLMAAVIVSWVAGGVFVVLVTALVTRAFDHGAGQRAGVVLSVFPGAYIATLAYAESLATMLVAASLWAMARDRPYRAGVMGALATFTSPLTLPIGLSLLWRAWRRGLPAGTTSPVRSSASSLRQRSSLQVAYCRTGLPST